MYFRAVGSGMAGTATAVPLFEGYREASLGTNTVN